MLGGAARLRGRPARPQRRRPGPVGDGDPLARRRQLPPGAVVVRREGGRRAAAQPGDRRAERRTRTSTACSTSRSRAPPDRAPVGRVATCPPAASRRRPPGAVHVAKKPASAVDNVVSLAKRRGFVYPCGEIYGGTRSAWDYGPLGVELKENIKRQWWRSMVQSRDDVVGLDSSVILPRQTWEASGHVATFTDPLTECQSCHKRFRADHLQEEYAEKKRRRATPTPDDVDLATIACPNCGTRGAWTEPRQFSGLLKTYLGVLEDESGLHYLRPETAQGIFLNFANVVTSAPQEAAVRHRPDRQELPQRDHPRQLHLPHARVRADGDGVLRQARRGRGVAPVLDRRAHPLVRRPRHQTRRTCGTSSTRRRSSATTPSAPSTSSTASASPARSGASSRASPTAPTSTSRRTRRHSGTDLSYFDQAANERYVPYVIEPAAGSDPQPDDLPGRRLDRGRGAQHQGRCRQAHGAAARPTARPGQGRGAAAEPQRGPHAEGQGTRRRAARSCWNVDFDDSGAIGRRYRRQDEIGTPYCVTVDFDTPRGRRRHRPRARHDDPGADLRWRACAPGSPNASSAADAPGSQRAVRAGHNVRVTHRASRSVPRRRPALPVAPRRVPAGRSRPRAERRAVARRSRRRSRRVDAAHGQRGGARRGRR